MKGGPIEPSADLRQAANGLRQWYIALMEEGFTEREAMSIVATVLSAGTK